MTRLKKFLGILIKIFLIFWGLFCIIGIVGNLNHYKYADWIVILIFSSAPYIIYFYIKFHKKCETAQERATKVDTHYLEKDKIECTQTILDKNNKSEETHEQINQSIVAAKDDSTNLMQKLQNLDRTYIETGGIIYRTDGKEITDEEIPDLIRRGYEKAIGECKKEKLSLQEFQLLQIKQIIQVLDDSHKILTSTNNLKTFESRLELATKYSYTLKRIEQNNIYLVSSNADYFLEKFVVSRAELINNFFIRSYQYTLNKAMKELKTQRGIQNRMYKFLTDFEQSTLPFDKNLINKLKWKISNS